MDGCLDLCLWVLLEFDLAYHFRVLAKGLLRMLVRGWGDGKNFMLSKYPFIVLKQATGDLSPHISLGKYSLEHEKDSCMGSKVFRMAREETNILYFVSTHSETIKKL